MKPSEIVAEIIKFALKNIEEQIGAIEMIDDVQFNEQTGTLYINYGGNNCITASINVTGISKS
jgi:hypothetical protein